MHRLSKLIMLIAIGMVIPELALATDDDNKSSSANNKSSLPTISAMRLNKVFKGRGDKCVVSPTSKMRKNHMDYILHQRVDTVHKGIRTKQFRFSRCVNCHADPKTNSVLGKNGFCENCHSYTAVSIDCFSCHTDKRHEKGKSTAVRNH